MASTFCMLFSYFSSKLRSFWVIFGVLRRKLKSFQATSFWASFNCAHHTKRYNCLKNVCFSLSITWKIWVFSFIVARCFDLSNKWNRLIRCRFYLSANFYFVIFFCAEKLKLSESEYKRNVLGSKVTTFFQHFFFLAMLCRRSTLN